MQGNPLLPKPSKPDIRLLGQGALWTIEAKQELQQLLRRWDVDPNVPIPAGFTWLKQDSKHNHHNNDWRRDILSDVTYESIRQQLRVNPKAKPKYANVLKVVSPNLDRIWNAARGIANDKEGIAIQAAFAVYEKQLQAYNEQQEHIQKGQELLEEAQRQEQIKKIKVRPPHVVIMIPVGTGLDKQEFFWREKDRVNRLDQLRDAVDTFNRLTEYNQDVPLDIQAKAIEYETINHYPSFEKLLQNILQHIPIDDELKNGNYGELVQAANAIYALPARRPIPKIATDWLAIHFSKIEKAENRKAVSKLQIREAAGITPTPEDVDIQEANAEIIATEKLLEKQKQNKAAILQKKKDDARKTSEKKDQGIKRAADQKASKEPAYKKQKIQFACPKGTIWNYYLENHKDSINSIPILSFYDAPSPFAERIGFKELFEDTVTYEFDKKGTDSWNLFFNDFLEVRQEEGEVLEKWEHDENLSIQALYKLYAITMKVDSKSALRKDQLTSYRDKLNRLVQNHRNTLSGNRRWMEKLFKNVSDTLDSQIEELENESPTEEDIFEDQLILAAQKLSGIIDGTRIMYQPVENNESVIATVIQDMLQQIANCIKEIQKRGLESIRGKAIDEEEEENPITKLIAKTMEEGMLRTRVLIPDQKNHPTAEIRFPCPFLGDKTTPRFGGWKTQDGMHVSAPYRNKDYRLPLSRSSTTLPPK